MVRPRSKKRRGDASSAPFCCPSTKAMEFDLDLCGGIYPTRAQDITASYATGRRASGAQHLHKTPLCLIPPHTQPAQPTTPYRHFAGVRHIQATTAPAACEPQALGEVFREGHSGEAAAVTERTHLATELKQRAVFCLLRFVRCHCDSDGAGLALYPASAVTERLAHSTQCSPLTITEEGVVFYKVQALLRSRH